VPFLAALVKNVVSDVEGLPFQQWMQRQFILDTSITGGTKLYPFILPSENSAATGQSALIALVYYRTTPVGDETLLDGRAFAEYHDATGSRIPSLGSSSEQAQVVDGEGFLTTLSFPSQGFDDGRITMDFSIGQMTTRAYLPSGITGDLQVIWAGTAPTGDVNVTQLLTPGGQQRNGQTNIARAGAGFTLGAAFGELYRTRISRPGVSVGEVITVSRNLGDGINWVVIKTDNTAGGITTVSKRFPTNELRLVSFPARPLNADPSAIIKLPYSDFVLTQYDPLRNIYEMAVPDRPLLGPIVPGRAFWMKLVPENKTTHEIAYTGEVPATDIDLPVAAPFGWNMIGSPFDGLIDTANLRVGFLDTDPISWAEAVTKNLIAEDIFKWIRNASALNDEQLKQEIDLVHQSSIKAFDRALAKVRRPEVDTHTIRNGALTEHDFADTINLLLSIGEPTVIAINSNVPVSPFPYNVSTHMDVDSRTKVLTRRITVHKSEIPSGRDTSSQAICTLCIIDF
jgi:hypothetical protein